MKQQSLIDGVRSNEPLVIQPQESILLLIERTRMGMQRKLNLSKVPGLPKEMREELVSASAKILKCSELEAINSLDSEINSWLSRNALPSIFRFGAYLFSRSMLKTADAKMMDYRDRRQPLIEPFVVRYRDITAAAREKLGPVLSAAIQWPDPEIVPNLFSLRWRWIEISVPDNLPADIALRERAKVSADLERQVQTVQAALRQGFKELIDRMLARLAPRPNGKKPIIRDSLVENMQEFLTAFPARYIANDEELKELVEKANALMSGVTPEDLRGNSDLQGYLVREFSRIDAELEPLVEEVKSRKITFDDDGDEDVAQNDASDIVAPMTLA